MFLKTLATKELIVIQGRDTQAAMAALIRSSGRSRTAIVARIAVDIDVGCASRDQKRVKFPFWAGKMSTDARKGKEVRLVSLFTLNVVSSLSLINLMRPVVFIYISVEQWLESENTFNLLTYRTIEALVPG